MKNIKHQNTCFCSPGLITVGEAETEGAFGTLIDERAEEESKLGAKSGAGIPIEPKISEINI
jgi:hypothetical protein